MHRCTAKEVIFIKNKITGRRYAEMTDLFNEHFCLRGKKRLTFGQLRAILQKYKLSNGLPRRFLPGHIPSSKGLKVSREEIKRTDSMYKPGHIPSTCKPIGAERINGYGYVEIKIADPNVWKSKHTVIWEKAYGPVSKGHIIIFADGNKINFELENLLMVSRRQLIVMNRNGLIYDNAKYTETGKLIADVKIKINDRKRASKRQLSRNGSKRNHNKKKVEK
jgi:hypothetical protein